MNQVSLEASIKEAINLLKQLYLFKGKGDKLLGRHSEEFKKVSRSNKHTIIHACAVRNRDFEIVLFDDSLFQFSFEEKNLRYAFIQNPNIYVSREDFLSAIYPPEDLLVFTDEELQQLAVLHSDEEYEQFLNEQEVNLASHIIRYDLALQGYHPLVHSYSHIHIGLNEHLRIPCSKTITPLAFVLFCIKHTYYKNWKDAFADDGKFETLLKASKDGCNPLGANWCEKETYDLYLA